jgi:ribosome-binding protein aMBF1 (putative translation factor)
MPKYSTGGGGGGGGGDACELCGRETGNLERANVAGAQLLVCSDCRPHDDASRRSGGGGGGHGGGGSRGGTSGSGSGRGSGSGSGGAGRNDPGDGPSSRTQEIANKQARVYDAATGDSARWEEEGTDYEDDRLPYLVSGYGDAARDARQDAGLTVEELADELDVDEDDVLAVEQGRAATANVGGSVVRAMADRLDVDLVDE